MTEVTAGGLDDEGDMGVKGEGVVQDNTEIAYSLHRSDVEESMVIW